MARNISSSPGKGKKIASFPYDLEQEVSGDKVVTNKVLIDCHMSSQYASSDHPPMAVTGVTFTLSVPAHPDVPKIEGTDLDVMLKTMRSRLDKHFQIVWESYIYVTVSPASIYIGTGQGMELTRKRVERGVAIDGTVLMREYDMHSSKTWKIRPWPDTHRNKRGDAIACIPETPENEQALDIFESKIVKMREALADFVAPDKIEQTLALINAGGLNLIGKT